MAKVTINVNLSKTLKKLLKDEKLYEKMGRFAVKRIKKVTRTGMSMESGKQKKLPPLTEGTISRREILAILNSGIHKDFSPEVSNLTMTGQLINSIIFFLTKNRKKLNNIGFTIEIKPSNNKKRRALKGLRGKKLETPSNEEIYSDLKDRGFGFLGMDKTGRDKLKKMVMNLLKKKIRRMNRKNK